MSVLVVDDERGVRYALEAVLSAEGHEVLTASSVQEALKIIHSTEVEAVVTDLAMPGVSGMELLKQLHAHDSTLPVVLITAHGNERIAVEAIRHGAYDYLPKPFDNEHLALVVGRAVEARRLRVNNGHLRAERVLGKRLVAESAQMRRVLAGAARVGSRDVTVLIRGETGVGKELVAAYVHAHSPRVSKPCVRFNCAAIPGELAEAELFGHAKGAFTGAHAARRGFFAEADGGTLILDEIGELPLNVQAKLLRALQEGEIQPVGLGRVQKVDVRVIASTNRDLLAESKAGRFREDLYYRLAVVEVVIPPLRERRDDIIPLAQELLARYAERFSLSQLQFEDGVLEVLRAYEWPGNVRQLDNTIAGLAALTTNSTITVAEVQRVLTPTEHPTTETYGLPNEGFSMVSKAESPKSLREQVESFEAGLIAAMLEETGHNQSEAARRLQVSRVTLIDKMRRYGL